LKKRNEIMANIGATTAFYKVETSLTRANNEVSKSMERLATGKQNANAGDRSSYAAMADTFKLDFVGTKAGIKGASVVMGYLETGMRVLDSAAGLVSRMQELAVLGANDTNTAADSTAIDAEFVAIAEEFNRLLESATYKGKEIFNKDGPFEDRVSLGGRGAEMSFGMGDVTIDADYRALFVNESFVRHAAVAGNMTSPASTDVFGTHTNTAADGTVTITAGVTYDAVPGMLDAGATLDEFGGAFGVQVKPSDAIAAGADIGSVTSILETIQSKLNTARVESGSQYAAMESAVNYTTDLTAQYELGYNTVSDVNFSMETAHLAKNQILQQAATAMLSQANQGQQGLLQLLQG
jgi:flagellin